MPKPFTLIMLGTDTLFTPALKTKNQKKTGFYPKGETLSVIASQIKTTSDPKVNKTNKTPTPYISDEVQVINGPGTMGSEVGDRIGRGVAAMIKAVVRGQKPINLIAHSRGAVESLLIAHEMEEIQKIINSCTNLEEILKHLNAQQTQRKLDKTYSTPDIMASLRSELADIKEEDKEAFFQALKHNVSDVSLNFFGIDPVPGDVRPITWHDTRFYTIPKIVKNTQLMFYRNERSDWGFTPIDPEPIDPTTQNVLKLSTPGHHGTGSAGNDLSQQGVKVGPMNKKATQVQKLFIYMMLEFLEKNDVEFKNLEIFEPGRGLGTKYKNRMTESGTFDYDSIYLDIYADIFKNKEAYEAYNKTNYAFMGLLTDDRRILKQGKYEKFHAVFPMTSGYVNEHHGLLMQRFFFKKLGLDSMEQDSLDGTVNKARELLMHNITDIIKPSEPSASSMKDSLTTKAVIPLLDQKKVRDDILLAFGGLINRISHKYLTSDWSSEVKQKEKILLFTSVKAMLAELTPLSTHVNPLIKELVGQLTQKILVGIQETVEQQYEEMEDELAALNVSPDEELKRFFNSIVLQLNPELKVAETEIIPLVSDTFASEDFAELAPLAVDEKIELIWKKLAPKLTQERVNEYPAERLKTIFNEQFEEKFEDFEQLHHRLQVFIADLEALGQLAPETKAYFAERELSLRKRVDGLIDIAAKRFYSNKPLKTVETLTKDSFRELVERLAIKNYGAADPIKVLQQEKAALEDNRHALELEVEQLKTQISERDQTVRAQDAQIDAKNKQLEEVKTDLNTPLEARHLLLIEELQTLTSDYLVLLDASKSEDDSEEVTAAITAKEDRVKELLDCLSDMTVHKPSERVANFYTKLNAAEEKLKAHRDPTWKRYVINVITVAGILITGILPGLAALAIYSNVGYKAGKSVMFWKSHGENVVDKLKEHQPTGLQFDDFSEENDSGQGNEAGPT